jgi:hypothetical protein
MIALAYDTLKHVMLYGMDNNPRVTAARAIIGLAKSRQRKQPVDRSERRQNRLRPRER